MSIPDVIMEVIDRRVAERDRAVTAFGEVTAVSPLTVLLPGDSVSVPVLPLDGYTPTSGATAILLRVGPRWYAIGERA